MDWSNEKTIYYLDFSPSTPNTPDYLNESAHTTRAINRITCGILARDHVEVAKITKKPQKYTVAGRGIWLNGISKPAPTVKTLVVGRFQSLF